MSEYSWNKGNGAENAQNKTPKQSICDISEQHFHAIKTRLESLELPTASIPIMFFAHPHFERSNNFHLKIPVSVDDYLNELQSDLKEKDILHDRINRTTFADDRLAFKDGELDEMLFKGQWIRNPRQPAWIITDENYFVEYSAVNPRYVRFRCSGTSNGDSLYKKLNALKRLIDPKVNKHQWLEFFIACDVSKGRVEENYFCGFEVGEATALKYYLQLSANDTGLSHETFKSEYHEEDRVYLTIGGKDLHRDDLHIGDDIARRHESWPIYITFDTQCRPVKLACAVLPCKRANCRDGVRCKLSHYPEYHQ